MGTSSKTRIHLRLPFFNNLGSSPHTEPGDFSFWEPPDSGNKLMSLILKATSGWWFEPQNIRQLGWLFPIYGKIKNVPNHQPDLQLAALHSVPLSMVMNWEGRHYTSAGPASAASFAGHILLQAAHPTCVSRSCSRCSGERWEDAPGAGPAVQRWWPEDGNKRRILG